jgi:hypothetical protein
LPALKRIDPAIPANSSINPVGRTAAAGGVLPDASIQNDLAILCVCNGLAVSHLHYLRLRAISVFLRSVSPVALAGARAYFPSRFNLASKCSDFQTIEPFCVILISLLQ